MQNQKILITGSNGMVGSYLKDILPDAIYVSREECDLTDIKMVRWLISSYIPDVVIHLAAKVGGIEDNIAKPAEYFDDNILMNTNIVKVSYEQNVRRLVGVLSTCIYPDIMPSYPMKEEDLFYGPPAPTNFSYAYAKRCLAVQIDAYNKQYGTKYNYIIPCNLYGKNNHPISRAHFISALLQKIKYAQDNNLKEISLMGTGKPLRQFMYAKDLANIIKLIVDTDNTESFNVAIPDNLSISEMANIVMESLQVNLKINWDTTKPDGQYRKDVSTEKFQSMYPNFRFTSLNIGAKELYNNE